ncbi:hypothetical protein IWW51_001878 [Coemansia sp. RSA 2702]|nr:hypothetical protein IWW51_001878 [Coemansia sp. RSA 2702]
MLWLADAGWRQAAGRIRLNAKARRWALVAAAVALIVLVLRLCATIPRLDDERHLRSDKSVQSIDRRYSCAAQPLDAAVWDLRTAGSSRPFAILPAGRRLSNGGGVLKVTAGQPVCVRIVVPPTSLGGVLAKQEKTIVELFQPLPSEPGLWDSIVLDAVGQKSGISIPIRLRPMQHAHMARRDAVHVYEGELRAYDADVFALDGVVEYRDAAWNYEQPAPLPSTYRPESIAVPRGAQVKVIVPRASSFHPDNYARLPVCQRADEPGRWISTEALPFAAETHGLPVYSGRAWLPYRCRLRGYTYSEFLQCLDDHRPFASDSPEKYTIHWFGDTNTRRALKKITSLGAWCSGTMATRSQCLCDDSGEAFPRFTGQNTVRDTLLELNDEDGGWSVREDGAKKDRDMSNPQARIYFHRWEGLTRYNGARWQTTLQPDRIGAYPRADLVVVSLGNMDVSFTQFLEHARQLNELVELLQAAYDDQHIVLRMPQYFCCRAPSGNPPRRMQRDRNRLYGEYMRRLFELHFGTRLHVWDVGSIAETLPLELRKEVTACAVNTVPSELVDLENLQLINGICNPAMLRSKGGLAAGRRDAANAELA